MIVNFLSTILVANSLGNVQQQNYNNEMFINSSAVSEACVASAERMGLDYLEEHQNAVKDLDGNVFIIQESSDGGFMVFDPVADESIESVKTAECPYIFDLNYDNYYFGPMNYYYRVGNNFYHYTIENYCIDLEEAYLLQNNFNAQLLSFRDATSDASYNDYSHSTGLTKPPLRKQTSGNKMYIDNYVIVRDSPYPSNYDGTCGFVAATIVLNYWDKTVHDGVVASNFKNSSGNLYSTSSSNPSTNLKDKLVEYNGGSYSSTGRTVANAVNKYCDDYNVDGTASWYIGKIGLEESIFNNRPAILFGWIPNVQSGGQIMHAVTCYGIDLRWWGGYFIVNYGWESSYSEVSLGFGFAGETMTFNLNTKTYSKNYTIKPSDYGFPNSYCSTRSTSNVNCDGTSFKTARLRCGYIEKQFVNLSPRKSGFDTAYLEYTFKNPVDSISINLSFWSRDERYNGSNRAVAYIEYKELGTDEWKKKLDLLNDINLSTDRTQQNVVNLEFPLKTREIRLYAHFDYIYGQNDRNKGRISIGEINIKSYS